MGVDVKDKGVMLELPSFMNLSPDLYACLEAPRGEPWVSKKANPGAKSSEQHPRTLL